MVTTVPTGLLNCQMDPLYRTMISNISNGMDKTILENAVGSMRNFVAKTGSKFFTLKDIAGVAFIDRVFETVSAVKQEGLVANMAYVCTLFHTVIENNIDRIDQYVSLIFQFSMSEVSCPSISPKLQAVHLQTIFMCFYYSPQLTLQLFSKVSNTDLIFQGVISSPQIFKSDFEKKRVVIGLMSLLQLDQNLLSSSCAGKFLPQLIALSVELAVQAAEERGKDKDSDESECE